MAHGRGYKMLEALRAAQINHVARPRFGRRGHSDGASERPRQIRQGFYGGDVAQADKRFGFIKHLNSSCDRPRQRSKSLADTNDRVTGGFRSVAKGFSDFAKVGV